MVGMHAARSTNFVLEECDLLVGLGIRFDDRATGKASEFCPRASIIHVDIDASELGKIKTPTLGIAADVGETLRALEPRVGLRTPGAWGRRVAALRAAHPLAMPGADDPLDPYGIVRHTAALVPSGGLGTMGFGLPAAIGAALAAPERTVVCFSGDGSLLMNLQELATAAEERANVKVVLLNNAHLGLVRQQQELFYGSRYHASRFHAEPDFAAIARGFGVAACDLGATDDPRAALARALGDPGPCVVNVPIDAALNVYPMVPPGGANRDMIEGAPHAAVA